jgi:hypothetical protein
MGCRKGLRRGGRGREMRGRGHVHDGGHGREVREEEGADGWGPREERELANRRSALTGGVLRAAGENGRGRGRIGADRSAPLAASEREREGRERGRGLALKGGVRLSGAAGAGLGLMGWFGPKWFFPFS